MKKIDWLLVIGVILISLFGLLMIYSSSYIWAEYKFNDPYKFAKTQGFFLVIGYILMYIVSKIDYMKYQKKVILIKNIAFFTLII